MTLAAESALISSSVSTPSASINAAPMSSAERPPSPPRQPHHRAEAGRRSARSRGGRGRGEWRRHEGVHAPRTRGLAEDRDAVGVAAEGRDVVAHPLERRDLIEYAVVAGRAVLGLRREQRVGEVAEGAEPVVDRDHDRALRRERAPVVPLAGTRPEDERAPVNPDHDRTPLRRVRRARPHVQVQAVLGGGGGRSRNIDPEDMRACMHCGPKLVAGRRRGSPRLHRLGRLPAQLAHGRAANGMPRNTRRPSSVSPRTFPEAVSTTGSCARSDPAVGRADGIREGRRRTSENDGLRTLRVCAGERNIESQGVQAQEPSPPGNRGRRSAPSGWGAGHRRSRGRVFPVPAETRQRNPAPLFDTTPLPPAAGYWSVSANESARALISPSR